MSLCGILFCIGQHIDEYLTHTARIGNHDIVIIKIGGEVQFHSFCLTVAHSIDGFPT